jgi:hypothetical protein
MLPKIGVMVWRALDQSSSGLAEISCQNMRSLATLGRLVFRDDRRVDGADRDAADSVGIDAGLRESFVDAGLIGSERTATLQHQCDAFELEVSFGGG